MQMSLPLHDEAKTKELGPQLPAAFDDLCKRCGIKMERVYCIYCTSPKPFATFQCLDCKLRLFLVEEPGDTPLLLWSSQTVLHSTRFAEYVQDARKKRKQDREKRKLRETQPA